MKERMSHTVRSFWIVSLLSFFSFLSAQEIPLNVEFALTHNQRAWGLMQRAALPENQGMLFYFPSGSIWMFNTLIDLSVAFLDKEGYVIDLIDLKAYPEMMDPRRPVRHLADMKYYPSSDAIYQFFLQRSFAIPLGTRYVLEMNKGWFKKHQIKEGDQLIWTLGCPKAHMVIHP